MELLVNDRSVDGQFHNLAGFRDALSRPMALRNAAKRHGRQIQCHRALLHTGPIPDMPLRKAIGNLGIGQRRAVMVRRNQSGPFWDDMRRHSEDDWLEYNGEVVTDTAVGEAAFRSPHSVACGLASPAPAEWCRSTLTVTWVRKAEGLDDPGAEIGNRWSTETLEGSLQHHAPPLDSWTDLREASANRFAGLVFSENRFAPLVGVPFARGGADRLMVSLDVLDRFARAFDNGGERSAEGHRIYRDCFSGERALFSDSSDSEKHRFRRELTFSNPEAPADSLFCPMHGKVSHPVLRLHFSWPVVAGKAIHVVYAGPKITRL